MTSKFYNEFYCKKFINIFINIILYYLLIKINLQLSTNFGGYTINIYLFVIFLAISLLLSHFSENIIKIMFILSLLSIFTIDKYSIYESFKIYPIEYAKLFQSNIYAHNVAFKLLTILTIWITSIINITLKIIKY